MINFLYSWQPGRMLYTPRSSGEHAISFAKRVAKSLRAVIANTFAYEKISENLYFVTKSNLHTNDDNNKAQARKYAEEKYKKIRAAYLKSFYKGEYRMPEIKEVKNDAGKIIHKYRQFKIMTRKELDELKDFIIQQNQTIQEINNLSGTLRKFQWDIPKPKVEEVKEESKLLVKEEMFTEPS